MPPSPTFFFYDLETSGLNPREDRIMQFAGQRTDLDFNPLGQPVNLLIKLTDDTLPNPSALAVTKITPQETLRHGISEAEFSNVITTEIFTPKTIALGYNTIRFDDEFIRHTLWRNFHDPYEWQWKDGRSRWDLLDLVRFTRALRPEHINWPVTEDGKPTNRLELLTKLNHIEHLHAHDALSDVFASIAVAKLIKTHQPALFDYFFKLRDKKLVKKLANLDQKRPFVYTSGRYGADFNQTTVAFSLTSAKNGNLLVFDLRHNLDQLLSSPPPTFYPIVKTLHFNKCPIIAPLGILEKADGWRKLGLEPALIQKNLKSLLAHPEFAETMRLEAEQTPDFPPPLDPESALYDGFLSDRDRIHCSAVRSATPAQLADFTPDFADERLPDLLIHYKARNFPQTLNQAEAKSWQHYRKDRLARQTPGFLVQLEDLAPADRALADELKLYFESLFDADSSNLC